LLQQAEKLGAPAKEALVKRLQQGTTKVPGEGSVLPSGAFMAVFMVSCVPMIGFGFVDNFLMILAGEYLEAEFGGRFHLSTLAA
jgi:hypothetical protein